tara:strand:+ start:2471 stop:2962 length:492 start_codon:yes stop_codon:yes gene_type:complete
MTTIDNSTLLTIEKTLEIINSKYLHANINCGGCGVFAKLMAKALKQKGFDVSFVLTFNRFSISDVERCNEAVNNNKFQNIMPTGWRHILLKVGNHYIDSDGVYDTADKYLNNSNCSKFSDVYPLSVLEHMTSKKNRNNWNSHFNRVYVSPISKLITKHLVLAN